MSVSLRKAGIPPKGIILKDDTVVPSNYTNLCSFNNKFIKQVPDACTNPGNSVGSSTHQHNSTGDHTHTVCGSLSHSHTFTTGQVSTPNTSLSCGGVDQRSDHTHTWTTGSSSPTASATTEGNHTHDAKCNNPSHRTYRLLKRNNNVSLRSSHLPSNAYILWSKTLASIPSYFSQDTNLFNRLVKIATCPGTNGGTNNHAHSNISHHHTVSTSSHSHGLSGNSNTNGTLGNAGKAGGVTNTPESHTHPVGSYSISNAVHSGDTDCQSHTHDTLSIKPASIESTLIKQNSISIRKKPLPVGASIIWEDTLASIPAGFALADGSLGTTDYRDKYIAGIPNGCTNPGSSVGSHTHQHNAISNSHSVTLTGTHSSTGVSGSSPACGTATSGSNDAGQHTHSAGSTNSTNINLTTDNPSHQHNSIDHKPDSIEVAIIEKI